MKDKVIERLESFGYQGAEEDYGLISFCIAKVTAYIKNDCNLREIPEELIPFAVDMVCGKVLSTKKVFAPDTITRIDFDRAIKQVQTGDTTVSFSDSSQTPEQRFDSFTSCLISNGERQLSCFRRLRW